MLFLFPSPLDYVRSFVSKTGKIYFICFVNEWTKEWMNEWIEESSSILMFNVTSMQSKEHHTISAIFIYDLLLLYTNNIILEHICWIKRLAKVIG